MFELSDVVQNHILFFTNILVAGGLTLLCLRMGSMALASWVTAQGILANIFVLKQIELFSLNVTAADVFTLSSMFSVALIQEFFSPPEARKAILAACVSLLFFAFVSQLHLRYVPSPQDFAQPAYKILFGPNVRIIVSSIFAYWVSLQCNIYLLSFLNKKFKGLSLQLKIGLAVFVAQALDTVLFGFLGLYGLVSHINEIILFSLTIKVITLFILSYCLPIARKIIV